MCSGESAANLKRFFVRNYKINPDSQLLNTYGNTEGGWAIFMLLCNLIKRPIDKIQRILALMGWRRSFRTVRCTYFSKSYGGLLITRDSSATMMPLIRYKISDAAKL